MPLVGEQTEEILREFGYSEEEIHSLEEKNVVRQHACPPCGIPPTDVPYLLSFQTVTDPEQGRKGQVSGQKRRKFFKHTASKAKSEPKRLRFCFITACGTEVRGKSTANAAPSGSLFSQGSYARPA